MAHPYRTKPRLPQERPEGRRLRPATFSFAFLCVVSGLALTGADRPRCTLFATLSGFGLLLTRRPEATRGPR